MSKPFTEDSRGVWPVMLTSFHASGEIDWEGVDALVDWYIASGVAGLFSVCLSSEMYYLSPDERVRLAARVVTRAADRVPVIAAGAFGDSLAEQIDRVKRIAGTGVGAVVLTVNQLAAEGEPDTVWQRNAAAMLDGVEGIPLGLYECPVPYHRKLSPELLGWAAQSGGFRFLKDTCCRRDQIEAKLEAIRGTSLRWFNANCPTLLHSLRLGGHGYSGIAANFYPELFVRLCASFAADAEAAASLQRFLTLSDMVIRHRYPASAKRYLSLLGLPIGTTCRTPVLSPAGDDDEELVLAALYEVVTGGKPGW
jgi:4-hydroxy-tetrahydrodipicolinate synthase